MMKRIIPKLLLFYVINVVFILLASYPVNYFSSDRSFAKTFEDQISPFQKGDFTTIFSIGFGILALSLLVAISWWLTVYLIR